MNSGLIKSMPKIKWLYDISTVKTRGKKKYKYVLGVDPASPRGDCNCECVIYIDALKLPNFKNVKYSRRDV